MNWTRTSRKTIPLAPENLWAVIGDIENWPDWDRDLTSVKLDGPVEAGATGFIVPSGGFRGRVHSLIAKPFTITKYEPGLEIGIRQPIPGGNMDITLSLDEGELVQEVTLDGPLRKLMVRIIGDDVVTHFDDKCARLAKAGHNA